MTITLNDEQARLLSEVVKAGAARSTEEAVDQASRSSFLGNQQQASPHTSGQLGRSVRPVSVSRPQHGV